MKQIMMLSTPTRTQLNPAWCKHSNTQWQTVGGFFTSDGEADDDVREVLFCLDCGAELTERPASGDAIDFGGEQR